MEVESPPAVVQHFVQQLDARNRSANAFAKVFQDYQEVFNQLRRVQVSLKLLCVPIVALSHLWGVQPIEIQLHIRCVVASLTRRQAS